MYKFLLLYCIFYLFICVNVYCFYFFYCKDSRYINFVIFVNFKLVLKMINNIFGFENGFVEVEKELEVIKYFFFLVIV